MALRDYEPERIPVNYRGQEYGDVRGLSFEDVSVLLRTHLPDLDALVELFRSENAAANLNADNLAELFLPVITQAPGFVANAIALAADAPTAAPSVQKWPVALQCAAMIAVWTLTFSEIGEVKKVLGIVTALQAQMRKTKATKTSKKAR